MKKIYHFVPFVLLAIFCLSFGSAVPAYAADGSCAYAGSAGNGCAQNGVSGWCDSFGFCRPSNVSSGGGGGINIRALTPYSDSIIFIINNVFIPVIFAIAFLTFLWGVYRYFILGADNEAEREKGKSFVLWGVIGFVVILSVWGLVAVVLNTFGLSPGGIAPNYPTL